VRLTALTPGEQIFSSTITWNGAEQGLKSGTPSLCFQGTQVFIPLHKPELSHPFSSVISKFQPKATGLKFFFLLLQPRARDQRRYHGYGQHTRDSTEQQPTGQKFLLSRATLALQPEFRLQQKAVLFLLTYCSLEGFSALHCRKSFPAATG